LEVSETFRGASVAAQANPLGGMWLATKDALVGEGGSIDMDEATPSVATCSTAADTDVCTERESDIARQDYFMRNHPSFGVRPYSRAAAALLRVEAALRSGGAAMATPHHAVEALAVAQLEMRACALEASGGRTELCSMDDILPLFVFVLLRSRLTCPHACARLLDDALSPDQRLDSEGRAVLLLESAARYITHDWDTQEVLGAAT